MLKIKNQQKFKFILLSLFISIGSSWADEVDDFIKAEMDKRKIPGLQLAIIKDDKLIKTANYGFANLQDSINVGDDTVFNLASITKAFTCIEVMRLVEQDKLNFSDPISKYLPNFPKQWHSVTLHQILTHTSGLPDVMNSHFKLISSEGEEASWQLLKHKPLYFTPGTEFRYNQANYLVLGKVIEQVTGKSYAELIKNHQFLKVSMPKTAAAGFAHFYNVNSNQARDYTYNVTGNLTNVMKGFPSFIRAGVGLSSNAKELAAWVLSLTKGDFFDQPTSLDTLWTPAKLSNDKWAEANPNMHPYAMGWYVVERPQNPKIISAGGGQSAIVVYPEDNLSIILLSNLAGSNPERFIDDIADYYIPEFGLTKNIKTLKTQLELNGYEKAYSVTQKLSEQRQITFDANELNKLANSLIKHNEEKKALEIIKLNNRLFSKLTVNNETLKSYIGTYDLPEFSIDVKLIAGALFIQVTGQENLPVFAESTNKFFLKVVDAQISFHLDQTGNVKELVLHQGGQEFVGNKVN